MIDLEKEQLISLREVPKLLPARPNGKTVHISAIYRWVVRGVHGRQLEVVRIGASTYTSREALQRFAVPAGNNVVEPAPTAYQTQFRRKQIDEATDRLHALLHRSKSAGDRRPRDSSCEPSPAKCHPENNETRRQDKKQQA